MSLPLALGLGGGWSDRQSFVTESTTLAARNNLIYIVASLHTPPAGKSGMECGDY